MIFGDDNITNEPVKLNEINIFSEAQLKKLLEYNISTAEQFVGSCATPEGFSGIMKVLGLNKLQLNEVLHQVKKQLPPELAELLAKPVVNIPPMGARKPKGRRVKKKGM